MGKKKCKIEEDEMLTGIDWNEFVDEEWKPKPVNLKLAKIRSTKRLMREIVSDLLNSENENGDSRAEVVLDELVRSAEKGNIKAVELILKLIGETDDKQKVDLSLPAITIKVSDNKDGIRETEVIEEEQVENSTDESKEQKQ